MYSEKYRSVTNRYYRRLSLIVSTSDVTVMIYEPSSSYSPLFVNHERKENIVVKWKERMVVND
jgi:hypothetical protein